MTLRSGGHRLRATRDALVMRDGAICRRCSKSIDMTRSGLDPLGPTVGHVVALSAGGSDELGNLRLEHRICNLSAGDRPDPPRALISAPIALE